MTIQDVLNPNTPVAYLEEPVQSALERLRTADHRQVPVLDAQGHWVGALELEALRTASPDQPVASVSGPPPGEPVTLADHPFEAARRMQSHGWTLWPVVDATGRYVGAVEREALYSRFAHMLSTHEYGAVLTVELAPRDYMLSEIVRLIESHGVKILSISTELVPFSSPPVAQKEGFETETETLQENRHRVTIKLNTLNAEPIARTLERFGYPTTVSAQGRLSEEDLQHRLRELLRYLEV
ncbi:MAG: hypothetical protein N2561_02050 [Bacteroidetes bacterium]|nr:hypothetical protein [Rhodothermia bacterium]MCS7154586.1 hypothetical protein [Bacteroidota bacterium]MCX7906303.1 hypothetical protein [Bacteroidota bacterium]MDW8137379.1 hypothetical protein [Bacteroidota bacterium]MDW8285667.1 hypothetical protein [Bacteroidota bacterium]